MSKVLIPALHDCFPVFFYEFLNRSQLMIAESSRSFNANRIKPELRRRAVSTDVNIGWLISLSRVEKELVWPNVIKLGHILLSLELVILHQISIAGDASPTNLGSIAA